MIDRSGRTSTFLIRVALFVAYVLPLFWIVTNSLKSDGDVLSAPNSVVFTPTVSVYASVINDGLGAILTSAQVAVVTTLLVLAVGIPAAVALTTRRGRAWGFVITSGLVMLLFLQMVPQPMTVIPLYSVLASWHVLGTLPGLILADAALLLPFAIMVLRPHALAVPAAIYEAAAIDGASAAKQFWSITIPMIRNGIVTVGAIVFISAWGEFVYAVNFLPQGVSFPVSGLLAQQASIYGVSWNRIMALAVITCAPLVLIFIFLQRRLINGLSTGAVK